MTQAVRGSLNRSARTNCPRPHEIDWHRTIKRNLHNYIPDRKTVIAERVVGYARGRSSLRDIIVCVDQSGSMATGVVYASIFGAVMASIRAVKTHFVPVPRNFEARFRRPQQCRSASQLKGEGVRGAWLGRDPPSRRVQRSSSVFVAQRTLVGKEPAF